MLASFVSMALVAYSFAFVSAQSVCSSSPFDSLACLTSDQKAATICASAPLQTLTITVTTTTLNPEVFSTTQNAANQVTVAVTSVEKTTKTVTKGATSTITSTYIVTSTENATLTTYVCPTEARLATLAAGEDPSCDGGRALSDLGSMSRDTLATACSCIGKPLRTTTLTSTVTAPAVQSKTTEVAGTPRTTTLYKIARSTYWTTVAPTKYVTESRVSITTSTKTESYAAPTFTHVYGPRAGCKDTAQDKGHALDSSIDTLYNATQECKGMCLQDSACSFVYIQHLFSVHGNDSHYECSFNDHELSRAHDLECGEEENVYGVAIGYDACDRGKEEL